MRIREKSRPSVIHASRTLLNLGKFVKCVSALILATSFILIGTELQPLQAGEAARETTTNQQIETTADEYGETNPEELSMKYYIKNMNRNLKRGHDFVCSLGYLATKSGNHKDAVKIFKKCAEHGKQGSKIWMSYMHQNGFGVKKDAALSTKWVEDAAKNGYSIGQYNYGLALLKGYGVKRDEKAGKAFIDKAAKQGDSHANELKRSNYDPDVVTPDADQPDKQPLF